jgi:hypothetical protein
MSEAMLSERMFAGRAAESDIEDGMIAAGLQDWSTLGCDWYDGSIEVHGIPPEHPMPAAVGRWLMEVAGFAKVYANLTNGWEIHFSETSPQGWWRRWVSDETSSHNKVIAGTPDHGFWEVSHFPEKWPQTWLENGYVKVVGIPTT